MGATIDRIVLLHAMPKYPAPTVLTGRRDALNCALETVERVRLAGDG